MTNPDWLEFVSVRSSLLASVAYDAGEEQLHVRFHDGGARVYSGITREQFEALMAAESKGRYFWSEIAMRDDRSVGSED